MNPFLLLRLWFGLTDSVGRLRYMASGFSLMGIKYSVEASLIYATTGGVFTPTDFVNPLLSVRSRVIQGGPEWLSVFIFAWSLPFLWIALSMSVRRVTDAGYSPWAGLLVFLPLLNLAFMISMCIVPSRSNSRWVFTTKQAIAVKDIRSTMLGLLLSLLISVTLSVVMITISVYGFGDYGTALFLVTPVVMGASSAYIHNRSGSRSVESTLLVAFACLFTAGLAVLLFALEGVICILMAAPIGIPAVIFGALVGKWIASSMHRPNSHLACTILFLPLLGGVGSYYQPEHEYEVLTSIEIDAPVETVWDNVIQFPDLGEPTEWYFRMGISCPERAHIEGRGVGAIRSCVFSTGTFVEPITVWEVNHRLAFDVTDQPEPMIELSPYRHVHPPHLKGYLRCRHGEFLLVRLPGRRTRLEGRTWYSLAMFPQPYWTLWSDAIIHRIHRKVLRHIKRTSEDE